MLYAVMRHRIAIYVDEQQYRWLKQRAAHRGSIAGVVRELVDSARSPGVSAARDPLIRYLIEEPPAEGGAPSTVETLDRDAYG
jgi:hypothetical protein